MIETIQDNTVNRGRGHLGWSGRDRSATDLSSWVEPEDAKGEKNTKLS